MKLNETIRSLGWLVRDTFRQSLASGICWVLLAISAVSILVCLSAGVTGDTTIYPAGENADFLPRFDPDAADAHKVDQSGVKVVSGELTIAFGALRVPLARDARGAVHFLQLVLAGGVADTMGLLLTLVWTAGFLPTFLDPRSVSVLLAKPASRWLLLLGKYVGVLAFVLMHAVIFVGGTWLALGLRTGIWEGSYLYCVPLLLLHFAIFFSFSLLLAVCTRSTVVCVFGSVAFWCLCWALNYGRHVLVAANQTTPESGFSQGLVWLSNVFYWALPKPADLGMVLFDALGAADAFKGLFDTATLAQAGFFSLELSVLSSLAFTAYVLFAATRQFAATDY